MPTGPAEHELVDLVSGVVGSAVINVDPIQGSVANLDYLVQAADRRRYVVKIGPRAEMVAEAWARRRLASTEVPVPEIVHLESDHGESDHSESDHGEPGYGGPESAVLIVSFLPGAASDSTTIIEAAGRAIRQVHAERLPGWGPLVVVTDGDGDDQARGCFRTWREAVLDELSGLPELVAAGIIDAQLADVARDCVAVREVLDYRGPGVLVHNDLKPAHLFALKDEGQVRLSGIIDWGDAGVGDPLVDLARLSMSGPEALQAFAAGYGIDLTPALDQMLARYRILWNIAALTYEHRAGGDWFDVYRERVRRDAELTTSRSSN